MDRFYIKGHRDLVVTAIDFQHAAQQLLLMVAQSGHGEDATLIGPSLDGGSFDGNDEVWKATVCLPDHKSPAERHFAGELFETIIKIA